MTDICSSIRRKALYLNVGGVKVFRCWKETGRFLTYWFTLNEDAIDGEGPLYRDHFDVRWLISEEDVNARGETAIRAAITDALESGRLTPEWIKERHIAEDAEIEARANARAGGDSPKPAGGPGR